jgi:hypothetical protein
MSIEDQRRKFVENPELFLTQLVPGLVKDAELADCLLVHAYDCINDQPPILDYSESSGAAAMEDEVSDKPAFVGTPRSTGIVDQFSQPAFGGKRRKQKRGGMPPRANESLRRVVKLTVLVTLLTITLGVGYVTVACIQNLAALYGFDTVTLKALESIVGLGVEIAQQSGTVASSVAATGSQVTRSTISILASFGVKATKVAEQGGKVTQMIPLMFMSRYVKNARLMYDEMLGLGGSILDTFRGIVNASGAGITALRETVQSIKVGIQRRFDDLKRRTGEAVASGQETAGEADETVERVVARIMEFIPEAHQGELNGYFESLGRGAGNASAMAVEGASSALSAVATPPREFIQFLREILETMYEDIADVAIDLDDVDLPAVAHLGELYRDRRARQEREFGQPRSGNQFGFNVQGLPPRDDVRPGTMPPPPPRRDRPDAGGRRSHKKRKTRRQKSRRR